MDHGRYQLWIQLELVKIRFESEIQILNWSESLTQETIDKIVSLGRSTVQNEGSTSRNSETASRSVRTKLGRAKFQFCPPNYTNDAVKVSLISFHLWLRFSNSFQPNLILTAWEVRFRCTGGSRTSRRFGKHSKSIKSQNSETIEAISAHFYYLFLFRIGFERRSRAIHALQKSGGALMSLNVMICTENRENVSNEGSIHTKCMYLCDAVI